MRAELIGQARARKRAAMTRETGRRPKRLPDLTPEEFKAVRRERDESIRRAARERMKREVRAAGIVGAEEAALFGIDEGVDALRIVGGAAVWRTRSRGTAKVFIQS